MTGLVIAGVCPPLLHAYCFELAWARAGTAILKICALGLVVFVFGEQLVSGLATDREPPLWLQGILSPVGIWLAGYLISTRSREHTEKDAFPAELGKRAQSL